jgi:hypothetical protein
VRPRWNWPYQIIQDSDPAARVVKALVEVA